MAIVIKSSKVPLVKVISPEIMYSGNHFSGCNNHLSSEAFLEIFTSRGFETKGEPIRNFLESFSLVKTKPSCLMIFDKNFGNKYIKLPFVQEKNLILLIYLIILFVFLDLK